MQTLKLTFFFWGITILSCQERHKIDNDEFVQLMEKISSAWTTQNVNLAMDCFAPDAIYLQPPDEQYFQGHDQLKLYFGAIKKGTIMKFHNIWFDERNQIGAGEFTFGDIETRTGVTGVTVVTLQRGKIKTWREYFIKGPIDFDEFISTENKNWKWHIGNYP